MANKPSPQLSGLLRFMRGIFTSDFHMFSQRSAIDGLMAELDQAAEEAELIVLGGDIVDFKWSQLSDQQTTEAAALQWLRDFTDRHQGKQIVYVAGNHDCAPTYLDDLRELAKNSRDFEVYEYWYQHGDALFLHGDVVHTKPTQPQLEKRRSRWANHGKRGRFKTSLYDLVFLLRLPSLANLLINRPRRICARLTRYLSSIGLHPEGGIRRVFFGHTHGIVKDFEFAGLVFYNSGAPLKTLACEILRFETSGDETNGR